jgi:hypothetical protein
LILACNRSEAPAVDVPAVALPTATASSEAPDSATPEPANVATAAPAGDDDAADPTSTDVQRVVMAARSKLRACYNRKLASDPKATGKVVYSLAISADGSVTKVSVLSNTFSDAQVAACIEQELKAIQFPSAPKPTTVQIPFVFANANP